MTDLPATQTQLRLARRPTGLVTADDFEVVETPLPRLAEGEALVRTSYLSLDPTVRTWLNPGRGYFPPVEVGEVVRCSGVGRVVATRCPAYQIGDLVTSLNGWQEYCVIRDDAFSTPVPDGVDERAAIGPLGNNGITAYVGLFDIGRPQPGQTVVVSAAAGATGSLVGQLAKIHGCRAVGIAGSDEKCAVVVDEFGFDACINYKTADLRAALAEHCPDRIDVYFDNVGGEILDAALKRLAMHARVVLCGAISVYNATGRPPGPANYIELITWRARMEGFNAFDAWDRYPEIIATLRGFADEGRLRWREHVVSGLERAPDALNLLFTGGNTGKVLVRVTDDDADDART